MTNRKDQPKSPTMPIECANAFTSMSFDPKIDGFSRHKPAGSLLGLLLFMFVVCVATANAQYSELVDFVGANGCCPKYPTMMAQGRDGNLYGTVPTGGVNNVGVVFKNTPSGSQTILYQFDTTHGSTPNAGLTLGNDGNFYGTTQLGSAHSYGNIFKITPSGVLTVLYDFTGVADGGYPVVPWCLLRTEISTAHRIRA